MVRGLLRLACAVALVTAATVAVADSRAPKGPIEVGPNVQVSKALPGDPISRCRSPPIPSTRSA